MTATAVAKTSPAAGASSEFPHVLSGVILDGAAASLAGMLDRALLEEAGWDPVTRILFLPAQHRLLGRQVCRAEGCTGTVHNDCPGVCYRCFTRLQQLGMSATGIAAAGRLPAAPAPAGHCAVSECQCKPTARQAVMCEPHAAQFRNRRTPIPLEQFLTERRVRPLPPFRACLVLACTRPADGAVGYCNTHYQRWRVAQRGNAEVDEQWWQATAFLPDLQAYLQDLLRTRERLAAAIDGVDEWARADATPAQEEITRIRRLITTIKGDVAELGDGQRAQIDDAVAVIRRHRAAHAVPLGMPAVRAAAPAPPVTIALTSEATA